MNLTELVTTNLIQLQLEGKTKDEIMEEMAEMIDRSGALHDKEKYKQSLYKREMEGSTGIGFGIAIPHGKSDAVKKTCVAFGVKKSGVDWDSLDGEKAQLIFMIAVPEKHAGDEHLKILQLLSRKLMDDEFREHLLHATTKEEVMQLFDQV
ncbi:PTS sugar transporter subunit IIA [Thermaerobacillus caldiproteolyticus]|uniref:Fructose-specific phosphotransferase system IIA component n=1 Tax=Thermaerobacillus caldiproteolyticus TaxID=247480 RepID=A0A7V9Z5E6_9BACL|nr:PTS sugar transporter subunit IIA [Anoxybacillus caldiproteolyticus]MBA2874379.1 fructose-specific phosphotransferase system IIA component [Anoxybacillus caldiproteolyticus]QPA30915.1 PTS sugar transporter subunit IIA [Anoxybacillus caldiproteolyticus]